MEKGLFTLKDLANYLSIAESTINERVKKGTFPKPIYLGVKKYWKDTDVRNWIDSLGEKKETRGRKRLVA